MIDLLCLILKNMTLHPYVRVSAISPGAPA
jgi:hypothetical protein